MKELEKSGISRMSTITTLRAGLNTPSLKHELSFRRQVYIKPEDLNKIPSHCKIDFDDTTYWIYPTLDNMTCFLCKQVGHIAKSCPTKMNPSGINGLETILTNKCTETVNKNGEAAKPEPLMNLKPI